MIHGGGWVYFISNRTHRIYIGSCTDLLARVREHKTKAFPHSFTARYNLNRLVYYEFHATYEEALAREQYLKGWTRKRKVVLIQRKNPNWLDLADELTDIAHGALTASAAGVLRFAQD